MPTTLCGPGRTTQPFAAPPFPLDAFTLTAVLFLQDAASLQRTKFNGCNLPLSRYPQTQACMVMVCGYLTPASLLSLNLDSRPSPGFNHPIYRVPVSSPMNSHNIHGPPPSALPFSFLPRPPNPNSMVWTTPWRPLIFLRCHHCFLIKFFLLRTIHKQFLYRSAYISFLFKHLEFSYLGATISTMFFHMPCAFFSPYALFPLCAASHVGKFQQPLTWEISQSPCPDWSPSSCTVLLTIPSPKVSSTRK